MERLVTEIAGIKMKNPVMVASGTFGNGEEAANFINLDKLGAIITKTITLKAREGNPPPRIVETAAGMLNSIGLQNQGIKDFLEKSIPFLSRFQTPVIVNVAGESIDEYGELAKLLNKVPQIKGIELNISCPNVKKGGMQFGVDKDCAAEVVKSVKQATSLPVIVKLSPNVTDIAVIAKTVEAAGADAISLINTLLGMSIDIEKYQSRLGTMTGGLSGPAIKPIAVRMVWQVAQVVKIPIIGIGGIMSGKDAIEFFLAGATAIQIGTANFIDTQAPLGVIEEINAYLNQHQIDHYKKLVGIVK